MAATTTTNDNGGNLQNEAPEEPSQQPPATAKASTAAAATASSPPTMNDEMQQVLALIAARSRGEVGNDDVEMAVSRLLQSTGCSRSTQQEVNSNKNSMDNSSSINQSKSTTNVAMEPPTALLPVAGAVSSWSLSIPVEGSRTIVADDDDYDIEEKDSDNIQKNSGVGDGKPNKLHSGKRPRASSSAKNNSKATAKSSRRSRRRTSKDNNDKEQANNNDNDDDDDDEEDLLEQIPLGRQGAKMMTTFGDGSNPRPDAVAATLLGARRMIQVAIRDARAIRRRAKHQYDLAKIVSMTKKKTTLATQAATSAIDSTMLFRAMQGYDKLAFDPKCGFDMEQLSVLFPEEMNAYAKWNEMHSAYVASTEEEQLQKQEEEQAANQLSPDDPSSSSHHPQEEQVGHLQERVAQFDARTRVMKDDWYLKFAEMRKGSFLPRGRATSLQQELAGDNNKSTDANNNNNNNTASTANWENRPVSSIRFLHWVGFDPRSTLPPPSEQITHALAFLCYDFFGRIVEKAVFLRNSRRHPDIGTELIDKELDEGDQLDAKDIEIALDEPDIRPVPLYGVKDDGEGACDRGMATQLYFGPGFEERLELEMEELLSGSKKNELSEEEIKIRLEESDLFDNLTNPPAVDRVGGHLMEDT